jgi:hypothetical protein
MKFRNLSSHQEHLTTGVDKKITFALGSHDNWCWVLAYAVNNVNG